MKNRDICPKQFILSSAMETQGYTLRDIITVPGRTHLIMTLCKELPTHFNIPHIIPGQVCP